MLSLPTRTISRIELSDTSSSETLTVDTSGLPFTARHLFLRLNVLGSGSVDLELRINADSTSIYHRNYLSGASSSTSAAKYIDQDSFVFSTLDATLWTNEEYLFPDALSTRSHKSVLRLAGTGENKVEVSSGRWGSTDAISSLVVFPTSGTMAAGSVLELAVVDEMYAIPGIETILA